MNTRETPRTVTWRRIDAIWLAMARRRYACCLGAALTVVVLRFSILPFDPIPYPERHDEFSYILGAETFALGRMTNPTHPMWPFFETIHVNMEPTYASKYPPAQALFLAVGIVLFGHPWYGVVLSVAVMCACLCWMLQGWVSPRFALLGTLLAVLAFSQGHYWIDSYWGGAVAGCGGALLLGAVGRLRHQITTGPLCVAIVGLVILANSRPLEGLGFSMIALGLWLLEARTRALVRPPARLFLVPAALALAAAGLMAYYNYRLTGHPTRLAYSVNLERYSKDPVLWVLPLKSSVEHHYRDPMMEALWDWNLEGYREARRHPFLGLIQVLGTFGKTTGAGAGVLVTLFAVYAIVRTASRKKSRLAAGLALFVLVLSTESFHFSHYTAPALGLLLILSVFGVRHRARTRPALVPKVAVLAVALASAYLGIHLALEVTPARDAIAFRQQVEHDLAFSTGTHLVFIRYDARHNIHHELVYNSPEIDSQRVVWAFDLGDARNRDLLNYYPSRRAWLMQPDGPRPRLEPYPFQAAMHNQQ